MIFGEVLWIMENIYNISPPFYILKGEFIMITIVVYWNSTKYTVYENVKMEDHRLHKSYIQFILSDDGREIIIPWGTINHIEVIRENS